MNELEKLIALSKVVAKPWVIATWVLAGLLALVADTPATVNHGLGYKFVHVSVADATGDAVDVQVNYVDENNLTLTANTSVTVSGVVSI